MYFIPEHFRLLPNPKDREIAASLANSYIGKDGTTTYGRYLKDGTLVNFSTTQDESDTHTGILIYKRPMGAFPPEDSDIKTEEGKLKEELEAYKRLAQQQELELRRRSEDSNGK